MDKVLKVLIVDDETNSRNLIKTSIDWDKLKIVCVGEATSGLEAIDFVASLLPDIIITDIQMPYMDGLALSKAIKESHPEIMIIILTAHDNFSYAQEAITIGVSNFILKPLEKEKLNDTLGKICDYINNRRVSINKLEISANILKNNVAMFKNIILNDLIVNNLSFSYTSSELEILDIKIDKIYDRFQISLINITIDKSKHTNLEKQFLLHNCCAYIKDLYLIKANCYVFTDSSNNIVLLNNDPLIDLDELSEKVKEHFKSELSTKVYCGIGCVVIGIEKVLYSYRQALEAVNKAFITDEELTIVTSNMTPYDENIIIDRSLYDRMKLAIKAGYFSSAKSITMQVLQNYTKNNISDIDGLRLLALNICAYIKETLNSMKIYYGDDLSLSSDSLMEFFALNKYAEIEAKVIHIIEKTCLLITNKLQKYNNTVSMQIKNYLYENFSDSEITLKSVANKFFINSSYLSRIFKKEIGASFTDYLINIRIDKAKYLLKSHDYKAYQLSIMVGIPDPNYFIKCFKKISGMSFAEYKNNINQPNAHPSD